MFRGQEPTVRKGLTVAVGAAFNGSQSLMERRIHFFQNTARISPYPIDSMEDSWFGFVCVGIHGSD